MGKSDNYELEDRIYMARRKRQKEIRKRERRQRKRKKLKGLDKYVIFCFVSLIAYTILQTAVTIKTGVEASTLTTCFFGVFGGEVLICALIKRFKLKNESEESEEKDE